MCEHLKLISSSTRLEPVTHGSHSGKSVLGVLVEDRAVGQLIRIAAPGILRGLRVFGVVHGILCGRHPVIHSILGKPHCGSVGAERPLSG